MLYAGCRRCSGVVLGRGLVLEKYQVVTGGRAPLPFPDTQITWRGELLAQGLFGLWSCVDKCSVSVRRRNCGRGWGSVSGWSGRVSFCDRSTSRERDCWTESKTDAQVPHRVEPGEISCFSFLTEEATRMWCGTKRLRACPIACPLG